MENQAFLIVAVLLWVYVIVMGYVALYTSIILTFGYCTLVNKHHTTRRWSYSYLDRHFWPMVGVVAFLVLYTFI